MALYLRKRKITPIKVVDLEDDLDLELTAQETKLAKLEEDVNALSDKPVDGLQQLVDGRKTCNSLCKQYSGDNIDFIKSLDTSNVTDMSYMFSNCSKITSLDLSSFATSKVTTMSDMFYGCSNLTKLDVSKFNTSNVNSMVNMFSGCSSLSELDLSNFDTSKVTTMAGMFSSCKNLSSLDLSSFDTSNVTRMSSMFSTCTSLTSLDLTSFNTSKVTNFESMFYSSNNLKTIDFSNADTSKVSTMTYMFYNCSALTKILGVLDLIKITSATDVFYNCRSLTQITFKNIKASISLLYSPLNMESLINTFNQLWDYSGTTTTRTLTLSSTNKGSNIANIYVKLITPTQEQIDADPYINNKKPCVVCESIDEGAMTLTEYATSKNWSIA